LENGHLRFVFFDQRLYLSGIWDYAQLREILKEETLPCLLVNLDALDQNIRRIVEVANRYHKTIRIATKVCIFSFLVFILNSLLSSEFTNHFIICLVLSLSESRNSSSTFFEWVVTFSKVLCVFPFMRHTFWTNLLELMIFYWDILSYSFVRTISVFFFWILFLCLCLLKWDWKKDLECRRIGIGLDYGNQRCQNHFDDWHRQSCSTIGWFCRVSVANFEPVTITFLTSRFCSFKSYSVFLFSTLHSKPQTRFVNNERYYQRKITCVHWCWCFLSSFQRIDSHWYSFPQFNQKPNQ
jgi:hypothetical protein